MIIPKPFARIVALFDDEYIQVPADASREVCEDYRQQLDHRLNRIMYQVDSYFDDPDVKDPRRIEVPDPVPLPE
jgi:hypothetical protein